MGLPLLADQGYSCSPSDSFPVDVHLSHRRHWCWLTCPAQALSPP